LRRSPKSMKGSQIHLALAHWKWHTPRVEKLSKALQPIQYCNFVAPSCTLYTKIIISPNYCQNVWIYSIWSFLFFSHFMLDISDGVHNLGTVRWQIACCLLLAWSLLFLCLVKGIKYSGKVRMLQSLLLRPLSCFSLIRFYFISQCRWKTTPCNNQINPLTVNRTNSYDIKNF
jgi:hypothetical protein